MNIKPRNEGRRVPIRKILIVCEGEQTEPNYFKAFRVASDVCKIKGTGFNTLSLVKEAHRLSKDQNYREVWCVFDRDSFKERDVRAARELANELKFKTAFSNECFELWYLLHFKYIEAAQRRTEYTRQLKEELGDYSKNSMDMYDLLLRKQGDAVKHAAALEKMHGRSTDWCKCTPYTSVHHLVNRLNVLAGRIATK